MTTFIKSTIYFFLRPFLFRKLKEQYVYLTFDDGPRKDNTPSILNILKDFNIKASFFMIGEDMEKYPDIVSDVIEQGHTIGYHSYRHTSLKKRTFEEIKQDIKHMNRLSQRFNYPIKLYRPPYGDLSLAGVLSFILAGKKIVMWSLDSQDSFLDLQKVKNIVSPENITSGEIILFHDDYKYVNELLIATLTKYKQAQLECSAL